MVECFVCGACAMYGVLAMTGQCHLQQFGKLTRTIQLFRHVSTFAW